MEGEVHAWVGGYGWVWSQDWMGQTRGGEGRGTLAANACIEERGTDPEGGEERIKWRRAQNTWLSGEALFTPVPSTTCHNASKKAAPCAIGDTATIFIQNSTLERR